VTFVLLALGLVMIVEGLAYALAPSFVERALRLLAELPIERRRIMGLAVAVVGAIIVWLVQQSGAV
jgi:uncharacterized protein